MNRHDAGLLLVISGPSGVGKTTITGRVRQALGAVFSVSVTTRPITPADVEGQDYHFIDRQSFEAMRDAGALLEWAEVFGYYYGTPRQPVEEALRNRLLMVLEIDVQGAIQVKKLMPGAFGVFVLPPSEQTLLQRLRRRAREDEAVIQRRFAHAQAEIAQARTCGAYDAFVINDNLDDAVRQAIELIGRERARRAVPHRGA